MLIPAWPVTCTARPTGAAVVEPAGEAIWSRSAVTMASASPPAELTLRLTLIISTASSPLRSMEASSGRVVAESIEVTASRTTSGAAVLVIHEA